MNRILLLMAVFFAAMVATAGTNPTNQFMIGDTPATMVDGKIVGDKWMVVSNRLIRLHLEAALIPGPGEPFPPSLRLIMSTGSGPMPSEPVTGFHGVMYVAKDWKTPDLAATNRVEILASGDKSRIVILLPEKNVIYTSTNSGMSWKMINTPGKYDFPLTLTADGSGFLASATLSDMPKKQPLPGITGKGWYAVASASDGSTLVMAADPSQAVPALGIRHANGGMVVTWPTTSNAFILQINNDFPSTNWVDTTNTVRQVGQENQVFILAESAKGLFRLKSR